MAEDSAKLLILREKGEENTLNKVEKNTVIHIYNIILFAEVGENFFNGK